MNEDDSERAQRRTRLALTLPVRSSVLPASRSKVITLALLPGASRDHTHSPRSFRVRTWRKTVSFSPLSFLMRRKRSTWKADSLSPVLEETTITWAGATGAGDCEFTTTGLTTTGL